MLEDRKTVTETVTVHTLVKAFRNQQNTAYNNMTNQKMNDERW